MNKLKDERNRITLEQRITKVPKFRTKIRILSESASQLSMYSDQSQSLLLAVTTLLVLYSRNVIYILDYAN